MKKNMMPLIGLVAGGILLLWAMNDGGKDVNFFHMPSIVITIFGSFCALLISFPLKALLKIPSVLKNLLIFPKDNKGELVKLFSDLSRRARKDGLLALEDNINEIEDGFLVSGLQMVIDGVEPDTIKNIMELKLDTVERRHRIGQEVFEKWAELAPAFGMLGTLIGLIIMLSGLDDAASIGSGMATALLTTFYGSLLANLILIPIASNLSSQTDEEIFTGEMVIEGILEIQSGSNPRILEEKLMTYLSPEEQTALKKEDELKEAGNYE